MNYDKARRTLEGDEDVRNFFAPAVVSMLAKAHFSQSKKVMVEEISANILETVRKLIEETNWIKPTSKKHMLQQLDQVSQKQFIAFNKDFNALDDKVIDEYYKNVSNIAMTDRFSKNKASVMKVTKGIPQGGSEQWGPTIGARMQWQTYEMSLALGLLEDFNFAEDRPSLFNYANTGRIIGHEIGHLWDTPRKYEMFNDSTTKLTMDQIAKCAIDLYNNYTILVGSCSII